MSNFAIAWKKYSDRAESALNQRLCPATTTPARLHEAMRYACLGGGKRFRAMLVYACGELFGGTLEKLDTPAAAVEMIHAYSLIHDDLPAMDDDELRRGQPSCHIQFDEATAILAGDALQSRAFEIIASKSWNAVSDSNRLQMIEALANASGSVGMAGGQMLDIESTARQISIEQLEQMHKLKTGALITVSSVLGALGSNSISTDSLDRISEFSTKIGLAFQITDDVLDHTSSSTTLGKQAGADQRLQKSTYVSLLGLGESIAVSKKLVSEAIETLAGLGDNTDFLEQLAEFVVTREY